VINNASSEVKASVNKSNNGNGEFSLDVVIEKIESAIGKNLIIHMGTDLKLN
jgi:hypothetical protein